MHLMPLVMIGLVLSIVWSMILFNFLRAFRNLGKPFNYRITDLWTASLCVSPLLYCLTCIPESRNAGVLSVACGFGLAGMLGGLVVGRLNIEFPPHQGARTWLDSSISIVTGAFIGFFYYPLPLANAILIVLALTEQW